MLTDDLIHQLECDMGHRVQTKIVGSKDVAWRRWKCTVRLRHSPFRRVSRIGSTRGDAVQATFNAVLQGERGFSWALSLGLVLVGIVMACALALRYLDRP